MDNAPQDWLRQPVNPIGVPFNESAYPTTAATDRGWEVLANYANLPTWWRGIQSVEVLRRGDESGVGTILRQRWRSRVPYTLTFDLEMLSIESGKLLDGRASGDLVGTCRWTLAPADGGMELHFDVNVRTGRWWMNLLIPFAPRIVQASFESIMGWGREGLARALILTGSGYVMEHYSGSSDSPCCYHTFTSTK